ncbi:LysM peptidoglycan-binding domain-containing protein, partial [bacterium]|nr:LysM peptidoglycan-binding domain-containing protein [bacterium]
NLRLQRLLADAEDKLFQQTTLLESAKKEVVDNEFKSVALEQQLTRLKLAILRKKMLRESRFPPFYTVEKNDSLWKIAAKTHIYDDPYKWIEVFYANKDKIADPDFIYPGMILTIPRPEFLYEDWTVSELNLDEFQREMSKEDLHALQESISAEKAEAQNR